MIWLRALKHDAVKLANSPSRADQVSTVPVKGCALLAVETTGGPDPADAKASLFGC